LRNKTISIALLIIIISAFLIPLTAYATELDDTLLPAVTSSMKEEPGATTAPAAIAAQEPAEPVLPDSAFTPDGQAEVVDWVLSYNDKEFYTITTPAGNIFYLIIDHARANNNVYFLNAVTEADLIALAEKAGVPVNVSENAKPVATEKPPAGADEPAKPGQPTTEPYTPANNNNGNDSNNTGMIVFVVIAMLAIGGIGYYIKIVRPKQQAAYDDDEDEPEDDDEDIPFDDEAEEDDGYGSGDDDYIYPDDEDIEENDELKEDDEDEQT